MRKLTVWLLGLLAVIPSFGYKLQTNGNIPIQWNMTEGVTPQSHMIYNLHMTIFWICVVIGIIVFGIMFYAIVHHRKSKGAKPAQFHENTLVEIVWTVIPFLILVAMALPATRVLIDLNDTSKSELTIKVTGYQWKWHYSYLEDEIQFFSNSTMDPDERHQLKPKGEAYMHSVDNPLVIPIHTKVRFLITSNDVLHSWWAPALGVKQDAVPGFINEKWAKANRAGTYYGQCAELCGVNHGFMPVVVRAVSKADYAKWVKKMKGEKEDIGKLLAKKWTMKELMGEGKKAYNMTCAACHKPSGEGAPPMFPSLKGDPIVTHASELGHNIKTVLFGRQGTAMQAFGKQLSLVELASIVTYIRNAWGNNTGDVVQPATIFKYLNPGKPLPKPLPPKKAAK